MSELIQLWLMDSSRAKQPFVDTMHAGLTCLLREERAQAVFTAYHCKSGVMLLKGVVSVWS